MIIPQQAINIFSQSQHNRWQDVVAEKVLTSAGTPVAPRTARAWYLEWKRAQGVYKDTGEYNAPVLYDTKESKSIHEGKDVLEVTMTSSRVRNERELIAECKIDESIWYVDDFQVRVFEAMRKNEYKDLTFVKGKIDGVVYDEGEATIVQMFSVWAKFRRKYPSVYEDIIPDLVKRLATKRLPRILKQPTTGDHLLVPGHFDAHFGRIAATSGYTVAQALAEYKATVDAVVARTRALHVGIAGVATPIGSDILHVDTLTNTTTRGTQQDMSVRLTDAVDAAWEAAIYQIERYRELGPVKAILVVGNHDRLNVYHLGKFLEAWFKDDPQVTIQMKKDSPSQYCRYGQTLLGFTHGDRMKAKEMPGIMADEAKEEWAQTKYRIFFRGHFHVENEMVQTLSNKSGVQIVTLPALCPPNEWEKVMGYFGSHRAAEVRLFHKEHGPAFMFSVFVDELKL